MSTTVKASLFYVFLINISDLFFDQKVTSTNLNSISNGKLNECQRCKLLTDSFNHWLAKTSRSSFEGGDAAWEETKLKSYARSEIRLVEIQESLCSELKALNKDQCYAIAEEAEQLLEKWWFHGDLDYVDLYTWLCIENMKQCCPQNHYGKNCDICPLDKNSKICGGHGNCEGEGTREGNGSCLCHRGYSGKYCEKCAQDFYKHEGSCEKCHESCESCTGQGADACINCKSGWRLEADTCVDVNECSDLNICKSNQYCVNKQGSYKCIACSKSCQTCAGAGSKNCTSCIETSSLWFGVCVNNDLKRDLFNDAIKRTALYLGLFCITYFVSRTSMLLASVIIMAVSSYIYFSEKISQMTIFDIFLNYYS